MARVSRRRCSKSARLSVGDAVGAGAGAGAGDDGGEGGNGAGDDGEETGGGVFAAAAPACLTGRVSPDDFVFAELERLAVLTDGGGGGGGAASAALAGVELR